MYICTFTCTCSEVSCAGVFHFYPRNYFNTASSLWLKSESWVLLTTLYLNMLLHMIWTWDGVIGVGGEVGYWGSAGGGQRPLWLITLFKEPAPPNHLHGSTLQTSSATRDHTSTSPISPCGFTSSPLASRHATLSTHGTMWGADSIACWILMSRCYKKNNKLVTKAAVCCYGCDHEFNPTRPTDSQHPGPQHC